MFNPRLALLPALLALVLAPGALSAAEPAAATADAPAPAAKGASPAAVVAPVQTRGINPENFDTKVEACDDFFAYSNGGWLKKNPIPADQTSWGTWGLLQEQNNQQLHTLVDEASQGEREPGSNRQLVGDFYAAALNVERAKQLGAEPIWPLLAEVMALKTPEDVLSYIIKEHKEGRTVVFGVSVNPDFKNPKQTYMFVGQGGLGLPDRDYYLRTDTDSLALLETYEAHISRVMQLAGESKMLSQAAAEHVRDIETRLAKASLSRVERREPKNQYVPTTIEAANKITPKLDWSRYFKTLGLADVPTFSFTSQPFFAEFDRMLTDVPMESWRDYLRWQIVRTYSPYLSEGFVDADFMFYQGKLRGQQSQRERWKRMVELTSENLGQPLGQLYVAKYFPPEAKVKALEMIGDLKTALHARLEKLDWMGEETRKQALQKFASFTAKIGYPDQWHDYSSLQIKPDDLIGNLRRVAAFEQARELAKYGKPTDLVEWGMSPQTINAYYNPLQNEIVFPAAILQPPFFDADADPAVNYGAMGAVIGHELMHGYDDQGSKYDAQGRLRDWWTDTDRKNFSARTAKLVEQYNGYEVEGLNVNGQLTLGENIADLGGVTVALDALKTRLAREPLDQIDGLSQEQRFFLSWSQVWRRSMRAEAAKLQVRTDPHSPARFRSNGPLSNVPAFAAAFECKAGDPMVNGGAKRVVIW
jgi:putative endopeptidase